jgi:hypothetical protein
LKLKEKYSRHDGAMRDRNGYELNTASTIAALLYGQGDFARTLELAFNFGWDCDNSAATAGTVIGVIKGYRWMLSQGWKIVDRYRNETRQNMPEDETISSFADRLVDLAEKVIVEQGGRRIRNHGVLVYVIETEPPANVAPLVEGAELVLRMRAQLEPDIRLDLESNEPQRQARAAYMAICLELDEELRRQSPQTWMDAMDTLRQFDQIAQVLFHHSPVPAAEPLREKALRAGMEKPEKSRALW